MNTTSLITPFSEDELLWLQQGYTLVERSLVERSTGLHHATLRANDENAWWTPIACGLGINLPGWQEQTPVDCPQCLAAIERGGTISFEFAPDTTLPGPAKRPSRRHTLTDADYAA